VAERRGVGLVLGRAIPVTSLFPQADIPEAILRKLTAYRDADGDYDALLVCMDWRGRRGRL
jgi:hypothetical protein